MNAYAMSFVVPVPANIADLEFSWQSLAGIPVSNYIIINVLNNPVVSTHKPGGGAGGVSYISSCSLSRFKRLRK